ncbi:hypothetical protein G4V62_11655 [Bacillaceae bacterium SIJ1]|uniref:hypothetical protein n=1 Tax=Litoribacterium kuwaitense TaxID=1398745 RepID=UPI0013EDE5F0|nr:hypothetical protein [Litoribacterium kuwaitense]NGP45575.1 hypothetical protein [Litoribacterium kuwaitense]
MGIILSYLIIPIIWMVIVGWFTGNKGLLFKSYQPDDDERKQLIKQKAIVQSWSTLLLVLLLNTVLKLLNIGTTMEGQIYPELFYVVILLGSYVVFYLVNFRKMSG